MRIFISAGEPSGDLHAANLIHSLRKHVPDAEFVGFGGPRMEEAGLTLLYPLVNLAVMWFLRVLLNIRTFLKIVDDADAYFRDHRPDVVVVIDYPGLHWWIARKAKERGIPVVYYVPPQIWAWAGWRVKKIQKFVDQVLCSLPFEPEWYKARGVDYATYVGHPYFDELSERHLDRAFLDEQEAMSKPMVAILPGSRTQEVTRNLPVMLRAAALVDRRMPGIRFAVSCLHEKHRALARELAAKEDLQGVRIEFHAAKTPELIKTAEIAWAVSGSVGLELLVEALPTVVLYTIRKFDLMVARHFIKSKYISLVNLLADDQVFPEYLATRDMSSELAGWAETWLRSPSMRAEASRKLAELRDRVAVPGASDRAAVRIAEVLGRGANPSIHKGPHIRPAQVEDASDLASA